jgi:tape measure domain-containing protein
MSDFTIDLGLDPSNFRRGLNDAERELSGFEQTINRLSSAGRAFTDLGQQLTIGLTVPIVALGTAAINAYASIQSLELGLESVAGSAFKAGHEMEGLKNVAKLPGLGLQEAVKGSINLQAIGIQAGKAQNILQQFGNAIATVGKGRVEFDRAIYGITQLANTEFPLGEDLNIIADALPQVRTILKDTFGKTRSDDLREMGVTSKQLVDTIITGLEKLPRVSGGIKNSFENLKDATQQNLARIGEAIDKAFNISGIIDKFTSLIDNLITKFENLSPPAQKTILVITGLAAATGPVLVGFGAILLIIPSLVSGFAALKEAVLALNAVMLRNPYTAIAVALLAIAAAVAVYYASIETASDRQERWQQSLAKSTAQAKLEVSALDDLYRKSQDQNVSLEQRRAAVDKMQQLYPNYFKNLSDEAILAGQAGSAYRQLKDDIVNASKARAATEELDRRNIKRLEERLKVEEQIATNLQTIKDAQDKVYQTENGEVIVSADKIRQAAKARNKAIIDGYIEDLKTYQKEDAAIVRQIERGTGAIAKVYGDGIDQIETSRGTRKGTEAWYKEEIKRLQGLKDQAIVGSIEWNSLNAKIKQYQELLNPKNTTERQLAELIPEGSIAELKRRAELLNKAIEYSVNGIVKVRGVDKFGKDVDKKGNPYYTGLVLPIEEAYNELERLKILIGELDIEPAKIKFENGFFDSIGIEYKSLNDVLAKESERTNMILNTQLPVIISESGKKIIEATAELNKNLNDILDRGLADSITDVFSSIGKSFSDGTNVFKSIGKSLLSSFGGILSELGKQMIQYGVSLIAIKASLKSLNPYVAIAAGIALVALGSGLTSSIQNQSNSIGGSGGVSSSAGASTPSYSSGYSSGGGLQGGEYVFRLSGPDLIAVFNRNVQAGDRVSAG